MRILAAWRSVLDAGGEGVQAAVGARALDALQKVEALAISHGRPWVVRRRNTVSQGTQGADIAQRFHCIARRVPLSILASNWEADLVA